MKKLKIAAFAVACLACLCGLTACNCEGTAEHKHDYTETVIEPTCTKRGYTVYVCDECGRSRKDNYTEALGHNFEDNKCTRCDYTRHDHEYEKTVIEPTCTEQGYTRGKCLYCEASYTAYFTDPLGHDFVDNECTRCGYTIHDHEYERIGTKEPTCTEKGYTVYKCIYCEESYQADFTEPLGHNYVDGECTRCYDLAITDGLQYTLSDDGSYYICSGEGSAKTNKINIPSTYNGKPVGAIGDGAFKYTSSLLKITIPESVKHIGKEAFYFCSGLTDLTISYGVTSIGNDAFQYCSALTDITIPESVTDIGAWAFGSCRNLKGVTLSGNITAINEYTFYCCDNLTEITIPHGIQTISKEAFGSCGLESVIIPDGVASIGDNAFAVCQKLTSITLPAGITSIGDNAFHNCIHLKDIYYTGTQLQWATIVKGKDWDLNVGHWDHSDYTLHCTDDSTEALIFTLSEDGTYYICNGINPAISSIIDQIIVPSTYNGKPVTVIGSYAFSRAAIKSIVIPDSITYIEYGAFFQNSSLKKINYNGTKQQWNDIVKDDGWNSQAYNYTVYCTDGDIAHELISDRLTFALSEDGTYYICDGIDPAISSIIDQIIVPSTYNGKPVKFIAHDAFKDCHELTRIIIQDGITAIEDNAFNGCKNLTTVTIPISVTYIGAFAFEDCSNIAFVYFNGSLEQWRAIEKSPGWYYNTGDYTLYCADDKYYDKADTL